MSTVSTFLGALFAVVFVIAVTSNGALKGPEAFALRWTVLTLAVAFSAFVAWARSEFLRRRSSSNAGAERSGSIPSPVRTAGGVPPATRSPPPDRPLPPPSIRLPTSSPPADRRSCSGRTFRLGMIKPR